MSVRNLFTFFLSASVENYTALNLTAIPEGIANNLGIDSFSGGILASAILLCVLLIPMAIWERRGIYGKMIIGLIGMGFCVAISWLPSYFMVVVAVMIALMISSRTRGWISG